MTNFWLFSGRFHPLVVHLPIGFLLLAFVMEVFSMLKIFKNDFSLGIKISLGVGTLSALLAVALGFMLASEGGYNTSTLNIHKWMGILAVVVSLIYFLLKTNILEARKLNQKGVYLGLGFLMTIFLSITGHKGGDMTHGATYLVEYAPKYIQKALGFEIEEEEDQDQELITTVNQEGANFDKVEGVVQNTANSLRMFDHVIKPIVKKRCESCHNSGKPKGNLILTSSNGYRKGGKHGNTIVADSKESSELYRRITLSKGHKEYMPTDGKKPLTDREVAIIGVWIDQGADYRKPITEYDFDVKSELFVTSYLGIPSINASDEEVEKAISQQQMKTAKKKKFVLPDENYVLKLTDGMKNIHDSGFILRKLSRKNNKLDVSYVSTLLNPYSSDKLKVLLKEKNNIEVLNLSRCEVTDDDLEILSEFNNLKKLRLDYTKVSSQGIQKLKKLKKLEYLNLFGTEINKKLNPIVQVKRVIYPINEKEALSKI